MLLASMTIVWKRILRKVVWTLYQWQLAIGHIRPLMRSRRWHPPQTIPLPHTISCTPAPPFPTQSYPIPHLLSLYPPSYTNIPSSQSRTHSQRYPHLPFCKQSTSLEISTHPVSGDIISLLQKYKIIFSKNKPVSKIFRKLINSPQI